MKIRLNITPKLTLIFALFAVVLLAGVSILAYSSGRAALEAATVAELFSAAVEKQAALNAWIVDTEAHATALSESPNIQGKAADLLAALASGNPTDIQTAHDRLVAELQVWASVDQEYLGWVLLDAQSGKVIAATDPGEEGKFKENQPYFIHGKNDSYVQDLYFSPSVQRTLLTISAPIRSKEGALLGVLAGNLDLEIMNAIISRRTGMRQSDDAFLVNTAELFVTQPRFINDAAVLLRGVHTVAVRRCLLRNSNVIRAPDYRGVPSIIVYRWLPERQLCLIVKMDQAEALAAVNVLRNNILYISSVALLAASLLAYWLARTITRPVQQLVQASAEIGTGKLEAHIDVKTGDEIEQLAGAFVQMSKNLQTMLVSRDELLEETAMRKHTEEILRATNDYLENLITYANAPIIVWDTQLRINRFNHAFEILTGRSAADVQGKTLELLFPPAEIDASLKLIQSTLSGERWEAVEINILHVDGRLHTVLWNSTTLFSADGKTPLATIAQGQDITQRKQAEDLLRKRVELLEFAVTHSLDEMLVKTLDDVGELTGSTIGFYHFVAEDQQHLIRQVWSTRTSQEFCTAESEGLHYPIAKAGIWADCVRTQKPVIHNDYATEENRKGIPEGHAPIQRELVVPILRSGKIVAILGVGNKPSPYTQKDVEIVTYFADIAWESAERKLADEILKSYSAHLETEVEQRTRELHAAQEQLLRQERLAVLGQLAGSIGHELRNPLGVISNAIYYLKMSLPDTTDKVKEYLDIIEKETRNSDKIVTGLLDFIRSKSAEREPGSVAELVRQSLERSIVPPSVDVVLALTPDLPQVYVDPQHIIQVLGNLITNAWQAMELIPLPGQENPASWTPGGGRLTISVTTQSDMIQIAVQDTGTGILPKDMKKLFEPLFSTKAKGIGLGLPVSKKLAEANGGRIEVQSEPGKGSTFTLYLPVYKESK
jgi:PAS domain S-box-containing protein